MKKIDLFYGMLIGLIAAFIGVYSYMTLFTTYELLEGIAILKAQGQLGKLITLGAILNLAAFFILLKINKELMARGVVLATILLTIVSLFA